MASKRRSSGRRAATQKIQYFQEEEDDSDNEEEEVEEGVKRAKLKLKRMMEAEDSDENSDFETELKAAGKQGTANLQLSSDDDDDEVDDDDESEVDHDDENEMDVETNGHAAHQKVSQPKNSRGKAGGKLSARAVKKPAKQLSDPAVGGQKRGKLLPQLFSAEARGKMLQLSSSSSASSVPSTSGVDGGLQLSEDESSSEDESRTQRMKSAENPPTAFPSQSINQSSETDNTADECEDSVSSQTLLLTQLAGNLERMNTVWQEKPGAANQTPKPTKQRGSKSTRKLERSGKGKAGTNSNSCQQQNDIINNSSGQQHNDSISQLLAAGEKVESLSEDEDTEEDGEAEVAGGGGEAADPSVPRDGLQITFQIPDKVPRKKRKGFDVAAFLKREMSKVRRETQLLVHQSHYVSLVAHLRYINSLLTDPLLHGTALSLIPPAHTHLPQQLTLTRLAGLVRWLRDFIPVCRGSGPEMVRQTERSIRERIVAGLESFLVLQGLELVLIFVLMLRSLGLDTRLVLNFEVSPLKPPATEDASKTPALAEASSRTVAGKAPASKTEAGKAPASKTESGKASKSAAAKSRAPTPTSSKDKKITPSSSKDKSTTPSSSKDKSTTPSSSKDKSTTPSSSKDKSTTPSSSKGRTTPKESAACTASTSSRRRSAKHSRQMSGSDSEGDFEPELPAAAKGRHLDVPPTKRRHSDVPPTKRRQSDVPPTKRRQSDLPPTKKGNAPKLQDSDSDFEPGDQPAVVKRRPSRSKSADPGKQPPRMRSAKRAELENAPISRQNGAKLEATEEPPPRQKRKSDRKRSSSSTETEDKKKAACGLASRLAAAASRRASKIAGPAASARDNREREEALIRGIERKFPTREKREEEEATKTTKGKSSKSSKVAKSSHCNYWAEVYMLQEKKWICVDLESGKINSPTDLEALITKPIFYILAINNEDVMKDVTRRYVSNYHTTTRKLRHQEDWLEATLRPYLASSHTSRSNRPSLASKEAKEDEDLVRRTEDAPMPTTVSALKSHPLYVLERHLLKFEAIYPPSAPPLGYLKSEPIFARECVHVLQGRTSWLKEGRVVRIGEEPYKVVKARPKWDRMTGSMVKDEPLETFGKWQTELYVPPPAKDGKVPRNEYGNVELFKPWMLPKGCVHIPINGMTRVLRKLQVDAAPAMMGWDFSGGGVHPVFDGYVVCEEFADLVMDAWNQEQEQKMERAEEKREKRVLDNWRRLTKGLLTIQRIQAKYIKK